MARHRQRNRPARVIPTTRVSVVVFADDDKILLVRHRKGARQGWVLPGGRLEYGENFNECAVREVKEETGLDVEAERIIFVSEAIAPDRSRHIVNIYVKARITGGLLEVGNEPVLAAAELHPVADLARLNLYPPVAGEILAGKSSGFPEIKFLGNLWV